MSTAPTVAIVGASLGGLRAASALRRSKFDGRIVLIGDEPHLPYDRPPLSKEVLVGDKQPADTYFRTPEFFEDQGIDLFLGSAAVALDGEARIVTLANGQKIEYDAAVIATGARPRRLPGTETVPGVHVMRTVDDAVDIRSALEVSDHLVVVGAGFIGSEVASSARGRGVKVTILEAADQPLAMAVGVEVGRRCASLHGVYGADLRCGVGVSGVEEGPEGRLSVHLADSATVRCDMVVAGIGVIPNIEWLESSGIELDGAVVCDRYMRTSLPDVYALGDLASWDNPRFGRRMRVEHWTNTVEQSAVVARNIVAGFSGGKPVAYSGIPYFWSDQYGHRLQLVGLASSDVVFVHDPPGERSMLALYREGDRLCGAFAIDMVRSFIGMRGMLLKQASFDEALAAVSSD